MYEKLKRALVVIKKGQKISDAFYGKLMNDTEIPKKMKKLVKEYRMLIQNGGAIPDCDHGTYTLISSIGESGAYGANYTFKVNDLNDIDHVLKIYSYSEDDKTKTDAIIKNINYFLENADQSVKQITSVQADTTVQEGTPKQVVVNGDCIIPNSLNVSPESKGLLFKKYDGDLGDLLIKASMPNYIYKVFDIINNFNNNNNGQTRFVHGDMKYNNMLYKMLYKTSGEIVVHDIDGFLAYNMNSCLLLNDIAKTEHICTPEFTHPLFYPYIIAASDSKDRESLLSKIGETTPQVNEIMWRMSMMGSRTAGENTKISYIQEFYNSLFDNDINYEIKDLNHLKTLLKVFDLYSFVLSVFYKFFFIEGEINDQNLIYLIFLYTKLREKISSIKSPPVSLLPAFFQSGGGEQKIFEDIKKSVDMDGQTIQEILKNNKEMFEDIKTALSNKAKDKNTDLKIPTTILMSHKELMNMPILALEFAKTNKTLTNQNISNFMKQYVKEVDKILE